MRSFMLLTFISILQACQSAAPQYTAGRSKTLPSEIKPTATITTEKPFQSSGVNGSSGGQTTFQERYVNEGYGYSIEIPKGLIGKGSSPPAPNHGVSIVLSEQPEARIWTDGSFNSQFWSTLDEAATAHVEGGMNGVSQAEVIERSDTRLNDLPATRITLRRKDRGSSEAVIEDVILALRSTKDEVGLVYSIGLTSTQSRYNQDKEVFDQVVQSWRAQQPSE